MIKEHVGRGSTLSGDKKRISRKTTATPSSNRCPRDTPSSYRVSALKRKRIEKNLTSITVVILCWHICLISESMGHHDSEIMDDRGID